MSDYETKRRFRQRHLNSSGYYERRQQQRRAQRKAQQEAQAAQRVPSMKTIFNAENLIRTYEELARKGGSAPGPDGITYSNVSHKEACRLMRELSTQVLAGQYEPSSARNVQIAKSSGRGYRTLTLRSITYRVVATALASALGPYFDQMFLPGSHGFRSGRGTGTMLVQMEQTMIDQKRFIIAQDDIRDAFDHVPIEYVLRLLRQHIDQEPLVSLCAKILRGTGSQSRATGIDQGSPLSPLMLNVALHHALDVPYSENAANPPWQRYADNLVYLCQSVQEGQTAIQAARRLLEPLGMSLKGMSQPTDLSRGETTCVLGYSVHWDHNRLQYSLSDQEWDSLRKKLSESHTQSNPHDADQVITGWIDAYGPAFEGKQESSTLNAILEIAAEEGYGEIPHEPLKRHLQSSRDKWAKCRREGLAAMRSPLREAATAKVDEEAVAVELRGGRQSRKEATPRQESASGNYARVDTLETEMEVVAPLTTDRPGISNARDPDAAAFGAAAREHQPNGETDRLADFRQ